MIVNNLVPLWLRRDSVKISTEMKKKITLKIPNVS